VGQAPRPRRVTAPAADAAAARAGSPGGRTRRARGSNHQAFYCTGIQKGKGTQRAGAAPALVGEWSRGKSPDAAPPSGRTRAHGPPSLSGPTCQVGCHVAAPLARRLCPSTA
jgi:hypothetical protein